MGFLNASQCSHNFYKAPLDSWISVSFHGLFMQKIDLESEDPNISGKTEYPNVILAGIDLLLASVLKNDYAQ